MRNSGAHNRISERVRKAVEGASRAIVALRLAGNSFTNGSYEPQSRATSAGAHPMLKDRRARLLRWLGLSLLVLCGLGFLTVADDLRHKGELYGVGTIGLVGILLLFWSWRRTRRS
jgi:hypothetical protein